MPLVDPTAAPAPVSGLLHTRIRAAWVLLALAGLPVLSALAQTATASAMSEYAVKAALLVKLPQFVYQPSAVRRPNFSICVLGQDPFGDTLEKLTQTLIDQRPVKLHRLKSSGDASECDVIFVSKSEVSSLDALLARVSKFPALTVSDIDGFAKSGGMVELAVGEQGSTISILINRKSAQKQNIEFNAQLLRLAKVIEP